MKIDFSNKNKNIIVVLLVILTALLCMNTLKVDYFIDETDLSFAEFNDAVSTYDKWIGLEGVQEKATGLLIRLLSLLPIITGIAAIFFILDKEKYFYSASIIVSIITLVASVIIFIIIKANADIRDLIGFNFLYVGIPAVCIGIIIKTKDGFSQKDINIDEIKGDIKKVVDKVGGGVSVEKDRAKLNQPIKSVYNLVMVVGDMQGMSVPLAEEHIVIGRDASLAHIVLKNKTISRKHCEFFLDGSKACITDYSKVGTFLNGTTKIDAGKKYVLQKGDMIALGDKSQVFKIDKE